MNIEPLLNKWEVKRLGELSSAIQYGYTVKATTERLGPKLLRITDIQNDAVDWDQVPFCEISAKEKEKYRLAKNDLLFARTGATVGKSYLIPGTIPESVFASYLIRVRLLEDVFPKYVAYFFRSLDYWRQITENQAGIGQPNVNGTKLAQIKIPVAPLNQQKIIVAEIEKQFSRLDEAVANLKRVRANLKRYKAAVLKAAVEGKLVSSDPGGWTRTNLGTVLKTIEAGKSFKCEERLPSIREVGVVRVSAVTWGTYNEKESKTCLHPDRIETRYFVKHGDFLFSRANTIQLVGACVIAQKVTRKIMLSDKILRFHFSDLVVPQWVLYWLRSDIGRKEIQRLSTGNQESMRNIGQDRIRQIAFALPSLEEQRAIAADVERRLSVIEELEGAVAANLKRAIRMRGAILEKAFTGQIVKPNRK